MTTAEIHNIADAVGSGLREKFNQLYVPREPSTIDPEFDEPGFDREMRAILAKIEKALDEMRKERE